VSEALEDNCLRYLRLVGKPKDHAGSHVSQFDRSRTPLSLVHMHLLVHISDKDVSFTGDWTSHFRIDLKINRLAYKWAMP
jgi:hypothetical protein